MTTEIFTGRVKWFNNKTGYGFITVTDGQRSGSDIFVHHSAINVEGQYKYLVQGEYVEFTSVDTPSGKHDCQAGSVNGIKGGKLMCTTRHETKVARTNYKKTESTPAAPVSTPTSAPASKPKQERPARKPKNSNAAPKSEENGEWVKVVSKSDSKPKPRGKRAESKESK